MNFLDFFESGRNLSPEQRKLWTRVGVGLSSVLVMLVVFLGGKYAALTVPAESPLWEAALQLRLILVRAFVALGLIPLGVVMAVILHAGFGKTEKARRQWTWAPDDCEAVKAAKTANAGSFLNALTFAIVVGLLVGVLR